MAEKIGPETLKSWLEDPEVFIMDLRQPGAWQGSPAKIKNAHHFDPTAFPAWVKDLPQDQKLVLY